MMYSARATSAAPFYFKPLCHHRSGQTYADGGIYHNNPINIADSEWKLIWPAQREELPDIVVSLGTGYCKKPKESSSKPMPSSKGIVAHGWFLYKVSSDHIHASMDSEMTWKNYMRIKSLPHADRARFIRINPELREHPPRLDAVKALDALHEEVRNWVSDDPYLKSVARRLIATCFFFVPYSVKESDVRDS